MVGSRAPHLQHVLGSRYGPAGSAGAAGRVRARAEECHDRNPGGRDRRSQGAAASPPRPRSRPRAATTRCRCATSRPAPRSRSARCTATTRRRTNCCSRRWRQQAATLRERLVQRPPTRRHARGAASSDVLRARVARARTVAARHARRCSPRCRRREEATVPLKHEIDSTLRAIIADVVDGDGNCTTFADLDGIVRVLGSVWFAELTYWSNGLNPSSSMGDNLASAADAAARLRLSAFSAAPRTSAERRRRSPGLLESIGPDDQPRRHRASTYGCSRSASAGGTLFERAGEPAPREGGVGRDLAHERGLGRRTAPASVPHEFQPSAIATISRTWRGPAADPDRDSRCPRRRAPRRAARRRGRPSCRTRARTPRSRPGSASRPRRSRRSAGRR